MFTTIATRRHDDICLPPIPLDPATADPERLRAMARENGPYFQPGRYLVDGAAADSAGAGERRRREVPAGIVGPVFRGDWARSGEPLVDGAAELLHHAPFVEAAKQMYETDLVEPEQVFVNLSTPMGGAAFSHIDIPEFRGIDRTNAPGWFLQAMGSSGLFEDVRITIVTAVAWFYRGERGFFRYWPHGRAGDSIRHERMWNTAVVGDNDFMHHQVEGIGQRGETPPPGMTIDSELECRDGTWFIVDDTVATAGADRDLATYHDDQVRLSLSWKARVYADADDRRSTLDGVGAIGLDDALDRFAGALDEPIAATGADALNDPALRDQLVGRWSGYVRG
ncbi:MAG: hypothetical protein KDB21_05880 [Acidimicrobiales bacterium]|nr:hypothetical protein [Acidimicrobiales bacterium]